MFKFTKSTAGRVAAAAVIALIGIAGVVAASNASTTATTCKWGAYPLCPRSVAATQVVDGSLPATKIVASDRAAFLKDTNTPDVKGGAQTLYSNATPKEITNIGGTFSTRHTSVGEFTLPKGTWLVNLSAKFNRKTASAAGDPDVQPMLQISSGGAHYVTIMGNSISPGLDADLTGSAVALITVGGDMVFDVNAFGYNSIRGAQGSGEITVQALVVAVAA